MRRGVRSKPGSAGKHSCVELRAGPATPRALQRPRRTLSSACAVRSGAVAGPPGGGGGGDRGSSGDEAGAAVARKEAAAGAERALREVYRNEECAGVEAECAGREEGGEGEAEEVGRFRRQHYLHCHSAAAALARPAAHVCSYLFRLDERLFPAPSAPAVDLRCAECALPHGAAALAGPARLQTRVRLAGAAPQDAVLLVPCRADLLVSRRWPAPAAPVPATVAVLCVERPRPPRLPAPQDSLALRYQKGYRELPEAPAAPAAPDEPEIVYV